MDSDSQSNQAERPRAGLVLPGGGARGAYQVGVLRAISDFACTDRNPFPVITGASVGAINAAFIASQACNFKSGTERLVELWSRLHVCDVYRTDFPSIASCGLRWMLSLTFGGLRIANPKSFLDNEPLARLLTNNLNLPLIDDAIERGELRAVGVTASSYDRSRAVTFFRGTSDLIDWQRALRAGTSCRLSVDHIMASLSLPFMFPAHCIGSEYFGDGSLRLTAPLSPAIRLGADRILVIGLRDPKHNDPPTSSSIVSYPTFGSLSGYLLDLIFMDNLDADIERLRRINDTLALLDAAKKEQCQLRHIEIMTMTPSKQLSEIAGRHAHEMPWTIRMLMRGIGAWDTEWRLPSYLLFEPSYIRELLDLGYSDAMSKRDALVDFLRL